MSTFTNQCRYCAFKLSEDQSTDAKARFVEDKYSTIRGAKDAPQKPRTAFVGGNDDRTETCFIDSPIWIKREDDVHCPDRIDNSLSLETALDLRESRLANKLAEEAITRADSANSLAKEANSIALTTERFMRREVRKDRIISIIAIIIAAIAARKEIKSFILWLLHKIINIPYI